MSASSGMVTSMFRSFSQTGEVFCVKLQTRLNHNLALDDLDLEKQDDNFKENHQPGYDFPVQMTCAENLTLIMGKVSKD